MNLNRLGPAKGGKKGNSKHSICRGAFCFGKILIMGTLRINGVEKQFSGGVPKTLAELLGQLDINEATVVAEIDGQIVAKENFAQTQLSSGQSIELVRFVGGG